MPPPTLVKNIVQNSWKNSSLKKFIGKEPDVIILKDNKEGSGDNKDNEPLVKTTTNYRGGRRL
jgi:hypothetical protein